VKAMNEEKNCWHCGHESVCELRMAFDAFIENRRLQYFGDRYAELKHLYIALAKNCEKYFRRVGLL
jgi:hypothetical protein